MKEIMEFERNYI